MLEPEWFAANVPKQATPADIHHGTHIVTISTAPKNWSIIRAPSTTFQHQKAHLPPAEKRLLKFVTYLQSDAESKLLHLLTTPQHTIYVGTDGGRKEASGSFAWLICSPDRTKLVCNSGPVDGWAKCQSSYRSELTALSSAMLFLDELTTFFEIEVQCNFQLLVDSTGAISALEHIRDQIPTRHYPDHADVVSTLSDASQILSKSVCQHVKSHQDGTKEFSELPFAAQVNVVCDRMATRQMEIHRGGYWASQQNYFPTRNQPVVISYRRQRIPSHYIARLRESITSNAHRTYLQNRYKWSDFTWHTIAWEPLHTIGRRSATKPCFSNRSKLLHNWLNLGSQRAKLHPNSATISQQCPYCQQEETFTHMLTCADSRAKKCRFVASTNLRKGLRTISGGSTLLRLVNSWMQSPTTSPHAQAPTHALQWAINQAIASQTRIGWEHIFRGIISNDWGLIYNDTDQTPSQARLATSQITLRCAIQTFQNYTLAIWSGRNEVLHSSTAIPISIREAQVNSEIMALYHISHTFATCTRSHFQHSLPSLLQSPYRTRQRWLILTKLVTSQQTKPNKGQSQLTSYNFSTHAHLPIALDQGPTSAHGNHIPASTTSIQTQLTSFFHPSIR